MKRGILLLLAVAAVCLADAPAKKNPFAGDAKATDEGRILFRGSCGTCHGIHAEGGRGPDLTMGTYSVGESDADLFGVISNGAAGTEMPEFGSRLEDESIWRLVAYIRSVARHDPPPRLGSAAVGEKLFWEKGQCGQCHRVKGRGGRMGPDLSAVGRQRSLAYLKESMLDPNADLTPGYATVTVVTRDGKSIVGVQRGFDNFSAQLMDVGENFYSFLKSDVKSMKREFRSLMPEYRRMFNDSELNDLLAYLVSLRGSAEKKQ